jgi:hypothetical protein
LQAAFSIGVTFCTAAWSRAFSIQVAASAFQVSMPLNRTAADTVSVTISLRIGLLLSSLVHEPNIESFCEKSRAVKGPEAAPLLQCERAAQ